MLSLLRKGLQSLGYQMLFRRCFLFFYSIVQLCNYSTDSIDNQLIVNRNLID